MIIIPPMAKLTSQRQSILDLINTTQRHWDADEVTRALADAGQPVGIATVYRGLAALEAEGLINSIQLADKKRYECSSKEHHDHMVCSECGKIQEFSHPTIEALQEAVASDRGFEISGHQLVLFGRCSDCSRS